MSRYIEHCCSFERTYHILDHSLHVFTLLMHNQKHLELSHISKHKLIIFVPFNIQNFNPCDSMCHSVHKLSKSCKLLYSNHPSHHLQNRVPFQFHLLDHLKRTLHDEFISNHLFEILIDRFDVFGLLLKKLLRLVNLFLNLSEHHNRRTVHLHFQIISCFFKHDVFSRTNNRNAIHFAFLLDDFNLSQNVRSVFNHLREQ